MSLLMGTNACVLRAAFSLENLSRRCQRQSAIPDPLGALVAAHGRALPAPLGLGQGPAPARPPGRPLIGRGGGTAALVLDELAAEHLAGDGRTAVPAGRRARHRL